MTQFELSIIDIIGTNLLTKFHQDQTINCLRNKCGRDGRTTDKDRSQSSPEQSVTNSNSSKISLGRKLLTKFHEDLTINVASRMTDGQDYGQRPVTKAHLSNQMS
ncbi:hypothetical protein DPMN_034383 [Dreissena polymorpha]|uniref:Uncharacterized protein n=1 Tax=Dreissena polymorpha TaxID=45954 RepID=A0A9D4M7F3_DREPO|nr:hypothetical protein DPMN_034383 [Dreissena polymorpha]